MNVAVSWGHTAKELGIPISWNGPTLKGSLTANHNAISLVVGASIPILSSETKCNTPADLISAG